MSQALPNNNYAWLSDAEVREAMTALTSDNRATRLGFFYMAARARRELARAINAELHGVLPDPPIEEIDFLMQYILEVDLEYPREIHDRDDDYPLAPELMEIKTDVFREAPPAPSQILRCRNSVQLEAGLFASSKEEVRPPQREPQVLLETGNKSDESLPRHQVFDG